MAIRRALYLWAESPHPASCSCWQSSSRCALEQIRNHSRPAGLMAGTDAAPGITMEVLVEWNVITPVRIVLESRVRAKDRPSPLIIAQKDAREPAGEFICDLP